LRHPSISPPHILMLLGYGEGTANNAAPFVMTHVHVRVGPGPTAGVMQAISHV
jgi:hypothetical protein